MHKLKVYVAVVGLPRYFNTVLPALVTSLRQMGASRLTGFFWAYKDINIPTTGTAVHLTPVAPEHWDGIKTLAFDDIIVGEPLQPPAISNEHLRHPLVKVLKLNPNPAASFSWLTAISKGAESLIAAEGSESCDFWLIVRPDLRISQLALSRLLHRLLKDQRWTQNSIAVAARPSAHRVLVTEAGVSNLPVDHFFIGHPRAIGSLAGLNEALNRVRASEDLRQPIWNEFLLGQFFYDRKLAVVPVRLPYLIWRGSLFKSIFSAAGRSGLGLLKEGLKGVFWNLRGLISPGLHKRGI